MHQFAYTFSKFSQSLESLKKSSSRERSIHFRPHQLQHDVCRVRVRGVSAARHRLPLTVTFR